MAMKVLQTVLLILIALFQTGCGLSLRVFTVPESFPELVDAELNITCVPDGPDYWAKYIRTLQMVKDDQTIAIVGRSGIRTGPGIKDNMQTHGHIESNASKSFLTITITNLGMADVGTYTCLMFYEDPNFKLLEEKASTNVTIDNQDPTFVVTQLVQKLSRLEKAFQDQGEVLKKQKDVVSELERRLNEEIALRSKQEKRLKEEVSSKLDALEKAGTNRSLLLQDILEIDSFSSAFSVYAPTKSTLGTGDTLMFKNVIVNEGGDYNMATGVYTTPKKGLYVFHLALLGGSDDNVNVHISVNGLHQGSLNVWDKNAHTQSSIDTVVSLQAGDAVSPYVSNSGTLVLADTDFNMFSGYFLKAL